MIDKGLIYARRSSETGDDYSLDTQIAACRAYADAHGLDVVDAVRENFTGTKHLSEREQGAEVWKKIQSREITALVVYTIDRLSRAKLRHALTLIDEILEAGVRLHVIDAGEITSTDDIGTIIRSWQAGEERKKIVDRLMRGKRGKAAMGKWVGGQPTPYGFTRVGNGKEAHLVHHPEKKAIILWIIERYLGLGEDEAAGGQTLRNELHDRGIRSPGGREFWSPSSVTRLLRSPTLIGKFAFGVELPELAIIDRATYEALQARIDRNLNHARRNLRRFYLLRGRIRCSCERMMTGQTTVDVWGNFRYYVCGQIQMHRSVRTCKVHYVAAPPIEEAVWQWVLAHTGEDELADGLRRLQEYEQAQPENAPDRLASIDAEVKRLRDRINALMAEFGDERDPNLAEASRTNMRQAADRLAALGVERTKLLDVQEAAETRAAARKSFELRMARLRPRLLVANDEQRAQALDVIDLAVTLVEVEKRSVKIQITSEIAPPDEIEVPRTLPRGRKPK